MNFIFSILLAALPDHVDPFARVENAVSFPVSRPQTSDFSPGYSGFLNAGLDFNWIDVKLTGFVVALPGRNGMQAGVSGGVGGGLRLKLPYPTYRFSPFIDADLLYARTATLNRFAYSLAAGLHVPVSTNVRIGPVVRFLQITDPSTVHYDTRSAFMLSVGLSVEIDDWRKRLAPRTSEDAPAPQSTF